MIHVFFDSVEIDANYIMKITQTVDPYNQSFTLGSTICRQFSIDIHNRANVTTPEFVYLYEDNDLYATLLVDDVESSESNFKTFKLTDIMVRFNKKLNVSGTALEVLNTICANKNITLETQDLYLGEFNVNTDKINERDLISHIAEVNGGYAYIDANGNLNIVPYENKAYGTIDSDMCSTLLIGEYHKVGRISFDTGDSVEVYPSATDYDTVSLNPYNIFLQDQSRLARMEHIFHVVGGFAFYNVKIERCPIFPNVRAGQLLNIGGWRNLLTSDEEYITTLAGERILVSDGLLIPFMSIIDWNYSMEWLGGYTTDLDCKIQEDTPIITVEDRVRRLTWEVDDPDTGVKAQLELKVSKDDNDQIISMINASADNIILNTKSLIFGVYPNGQYITVSNYYSGSDPVGVLFDGTGIVAFESNGTFVVDNYNSSDNISNRLRIRTTEERSEIYLLNNQFENSEARANYVLAYSDNVRNNLIISGYEYGTDILANQIRLYSNSSSTNQVSISNMHNGDTMNVFSMHSGINLNNITFTNYNASGDLANSLYIIRSEDTDVSTIALQNFRGDGTLINSITLRNDRGIELTNANSNGVPVSRITLGTDGLLSIVGTPSGYTFKIGTVGNSTNTDRRHLYIGTSNIDSVSGSYAAGSVIINSPDFYINGYRIYFNNGYVRCTAV